MVLFSAVQLFPGFIVWNLLCPSLNRLCRTQYLFSPKIPPTLSPKALPSHSYFLEPSYITLTLYDATGREVDALASGFMDAGEHDVEFQRGNLPSGVYFYRLQSGGQSQARAMVVLP